MADDDNKPGDEISGEEYEQQLQEEFAHIKDEISGMVSDLSEEQIALLEDVYYLWLCWGDFHLYIMKPEFDEQLPPIMIMPEYDKKTKTYEHVYPIADYGDRLSTSPGQSLAEEGRTTGKLLNTVEKMISIAIERGKQGSGTAEEEIQFAFLGVDVAQRRAYKLCLDTQENVVVTNFEPGEWGERLFNSTSELLKRGYLPVVKHYKI